MKRNFTKLGSFLAVLACVGMNVQGVSPYINKVYDFVPAPGQFVNKLPEYELGDSKAQMITKVEEMICGDERGTISLGGYGGYVVFGFDDLIVNVAGEYDFKVWGNATNGGAEPGIVMVSYDANGNGLPDDEWYELAGSEYNSSATVKNYKITYTKPESATADVPWSSNQGTSGSITRNTFHTQSYYPEWLTGSELVFEGTKLADNYTKEGSIYTLNAYSWGYVDNVLNAEDAGFKIEWAVDKDGNPVYLPGVNFVKVYTALNQVCGWIGETSTEVCGAEDLHPTASVGGVINDESVLYYDKATNEIVADGKVDLYDVRGLKIASCEDGRMSIDNLSKGLYIAKGRTKTIKFIK